MGGGRAFGAEGPPGATTRGGPAGLSVKVGGAGCKSETTGTAFLACESVKASLLAAAGAGVLPVTNPSAALNQEGLYARRIR